MRRCVLFGPVRRTGIRSGAGVRRRRVRSTRTSPTPRSGSTRCFSTSSPPTSTNPTGPRFQESEMSSSRWWTPIGCSRPTWCSGPTGSTPEEVWARTSSIPGIQLKLGKIRGTFGKHGQLHTHAFPFIQAPVVMANTIGEEGFKDAGMEASWLTPLPWYAEVTEGVPGRRWGRRAPARLRVDPPRQHPLPGSPEERVRRERRDHDGSRRLAFSGGKGADGHRHAAYGADLTLRNVPLRDSNRRGWIAQAEYIEKGTYADGTYHREQHGGYASFQYRWAQVWWTGIRGEQAWDSFTDVLVDDAGDPIAGKVTRASANIAWTPSEFSVHPARVQLRPGRRRQRIQAPRPTTDGADELHDRLPPGPCVLRRGRWS